ncbi:MAG: reprolysin-like metallopeptidase, partial [Nevskiales bacterium]
MNRNLSHETPAIGRHRLAFAVLAGILALTAGAARSGPEPVLWTDVEQAKARAQLPSTAQTWTDLKRFRLVRLDESALKLLLSRVLATGAERPDLATTISLPQPDGGFERFRIWPDTVMSPELQDSMDAAGWPMRVYTGESLDRPGTTVKLDWGGPDGLHASVLSPIDAYYIDPRWRGDTTHYAIYRKVDIDTRGRKPFECSTTGEPVDESARSTRPPGLQARTGGNRRTYRLAMATTGEFTQDRAQAAGVSGGSDAQKKAATQAAITTGTARINQIYERELSINLTLVNNTDIIFTNAATDPYTTANDNAQVTENQAAIDTAVGNANYDVGHVLDTGGAGLAAGSSVCNAAQKAQGKSANSPHFGDALYVDYVAHEIGHQFGANHSYNTVTSTCNTRNPSTAYEPGSGSTIMAYANICGGGEDLQQLSDPNFHYVSLDEMLTFTAPGTGGGDACAAKTASNASDPTVSAGANFTIPKSTPFELTAVNGSDAESPANQLTHSWEQYDLSANAQTLPQTAADTSTGPLMRSFPPVFSPTRSFPRLS